MPQRLSKEKFIRVLAPHRCLTLSPVYSSDDRIWWALVGLLEVTEHVEQTNFGGCC
jgi:hypothetical protein